jgi:hypothetical protein
MEIMHKKYFAIAAGPRNMGWLSLVVAKVVFMQVNLC